MSQDNEIIEETASELLQKLGFSPESIEVHSDDQEVYHLDLEVQEEDSGILIGHHGDTLHALQMIISQIVFQKLGEWRRLVVNIGDYREKRRLALENLAQNAAQRSKLSSQTIVLPYLNSAERRIIHLTLSEDPDVETWSEGKGRARRLNIKLKQESDSQPEEEKNE